jgi:hypothetical protein
MAAFDEVWGLGPKPQPPPPQHAQHAQHTQHAQHRRPGPPYEPPPPAPALRQAVQQASSQQEHNLAAVANRQATGMIPADLANANAAASNAHALSALHEALMDLRSELDETRRKLPAEVAVGAVVAQHHPTRAAPSNNDALTVTVGIGFALLILCIALVGGAICRIIRP